MLGRTVGIYRIEELIGEGGMGTVYRAVDTVLGRDVALKMLHPHLISQSSFFERFRNEAQLLARLNHPNIAILHNFLEDRGDYFMVMEYIEGTDLEKLLKTRGAFTAKETLDIMRRVLDGLQHAHSRGVYHRDLKPANLILTPDGQVKIMDFGIAKAVNGEKLTQVNRLVGTLEYMAPELLKGEDSTAASDLYAIGIVIYEMLSGEMPFTATTDYDLMQQIMKTRPKAINGLAEKVPEKLNKAITRLLEKSPARRPESAAELKTELETIEIPVLAATSGGIRKPELKLPKVRMPDVKMPHLRLPKVGLPQNIDKIWLILGGSMLMALGILWYADSDSQEPAEVSPKEEVTLEPIIENEGGRSGVQIAELISPGSEQAEETVDQKPEKPKEPNESPKKSPPKEKEDEKSDNEKETEEEAPKKVTEEKPKEEEKEMPEEDIKQDPPAEPAKISLGGEKVTLALQETISSDQVKEGSRVLFKVQKPLVVKGKTVLQAGALARGQVSDLRKSTAFRKETLEIRIQEVMAGNGEWIPLRAAVFRQVSGSSSDPVVFKSGQSFIVQLNYKTIVIK